MEHQVCECVLSLCCDARIVYSGLTEQRLVTAAPALRSAASLHVQKIMQKLDGCEVVQTQARRAQQRWSENLIGPGSSGKPVHFCKRAAGPAI